MGVSTDAILVFGFDCGETQPIKDWIDDLIAEEAHLIRPAGSWDNPDVRAYHDARREAIEACPVDIVDHCSGEYPMYVVALRGSEIRSSRGHSTVIDPAALNVAPERIVAMKAWCEAHGIQWREPSWLLVSYWG